MEHGVKNTKYGAQDIKYAIKKMKNLNALFFFNLNCFNFNLYQWFVNEKS